MNRYNPNLSYGLICAILIFANPASGSDTPILRDRHKFSAALMKVKVGMSKSEILVLVGIPDDKLSPNDLNIKLSPGTTISITGLKEIWCYGTREHLRFPTLGQIQIDNDDKVQYISGGTGVPIDKQLFSEPEIRRLLELINETPHANYIYNPVRIIQIVNTLQPLGKIRALAIIDEYIRVSSARHNQARDGLFLVLRVLFEVPNDSGFIPLTQLNPHLTSPPAPSSPKLFPRFPITIIDDIPLLLIEGYNFFGIGEPVQNKISYFRKHGIIRKTILQPSIDPLSILDKLIISKEWKEWSNEFPTKFDIFFHDFDERLYKISIAEQLLRFIATVYPMKVDKYGHRLSSCRNRQQPFHIKWNSIKKNVNKLDIVWDSPRNIYTFRSGSFISEK